MVGAVVWFSDVTPICRRRLNVSRTTTSWIICPSSKVSKVDFPPGRSFAGGGTFPNDAAMCTREDYKGRDAFD